MLMDLDVNGNKSAPSAGALLFGTYGQSNGQQYYGIAGTSAQTSYVRDYPRDSSSNIGFVSETPPLTALIIQLTTFMAMITILKSILSWHDSVTGEELSVVRAGTTALGAIDATSSRTRAQISAGIAQCLPGVLLRNTAGQYYGAFDPTTYQANTNNNGTT